MHSRFQSPHAFRIKHRHVSTSAVPPSAAFMSASFMIKKASLQAGGAMVPGLRQGRIRLRRRSPAFVFLKAPEKAPRRQRRAVL